MKIFLLLLVGCVSFQGVVTLNIISQWVSTVTNFSTQWTATVCSAAQLIGPPDVYPTYGSDDRSWSTLLSGVPDDFIEFQIATPVCVTSVSTYETWFTGFVVRILALNPTGTWVELWSGPAANLLSSQIFSPTLRNVSFTTNTFRIITDGTAGGAHWYQLDAIRIDGSLSCTIKRGVNAVYWVGQSLLCSRLMNHTIETDDATSAMSCAELCLRNAACVSFNFAAVLPNGNCELNNQTHVDDAGSLSSATTGWHYYYPK